MSEGGHPTSRGAASACTTNELRQASVTEMFPRVAFEYGQTWWAFSRRDRAVAASRSGRVAEISTMSPKPSAFLPMPTLAVTVEPEMSAFSWRATTPRAPWKQALYPQG
jgi:hypothetical protein